MGAHLHGSSKWILLLTIVIPLVICHQKVIIDLGVRQVEGIVNRLTPIQMYPNISIIHSAKATSDEDSKYIVVHPATVYPSPPDLFSFRSYLALPSNAESLLEELRTYQSSHYKDMVIVGSYVFLHLLPNKIVIAKENHQGRSMFQLENSYDLEGLSFKNQTKMYKVKDSKEIQVLLVVANSSIVYKLGFTQFHQLKLSHNSDISHLQFIDDQVFVAAQRSRGVNIYKIFRDELRVVQSFSCQDLGFNTSLVKKEQVEITSEFKKFLQGKQQSGCSVSDLFFNSSTNTLYILQSRTGLYKTNLHASTSKETTYSLNNVTLISEIKDCEALDVVSDYHFVLVCRVSMPNSYVQEIVKYADPTQSGKEIYIKNNPIFHSCKLKDLLVTQDFFLIFDSFSIDVFWNEVKTGSLNELSTEHSRQHFNLPGLEVFAIQKKESRIELYVVESNVLFKYDLRVYLGKVFAYSPVPVQKQIKVHVPGKCAGDKYNSLTIGKQINTSVECVYEVKVLLNIQQKLKAVSPEKVSMSIGAIIIMLAVMLILTWICLVKYLGLENHARRVLDRYRQSSRHDNRLTI